MRTLSTGQARVLFDPHIAIADITDFAYGDVNLSKVSRMYHHISVCCYIVFAALLAACFVGSSLSHVG